MSKEIVTYIHEALRMAVRFFYDLQKLRIQTDNRSTSDTADLEKDDQSYLAIAGTTLNQLEKDVLREISKLLKGVPIYETFLKDVSGIGPTLSGVIISEISMCRFVNPDFLADATFGEEFEMGNTTYFRVQLTERRKKRDGKMQRIERDLLCFKRGNEVWEDCCPTASSLWAYCGLAVDQETGKAVRRKKGQKANWNPFVKTKMIGVLADCVIKADGVSRAKAMSDGIARVHGDDYLGSEKYAKDMEKLGVVLKLNKKGKYPATVEEKLFLIDAEDIGYKDLWSRDPWVPILEGYKHRLTTKLGPCSACNEGEGPTGKVKKLDANGKLVLKDKKQVMTKCANCEGTKRGPWGNSQAHRHNAAKRYMVKMFLLELHKRWRKLEGLEVRPPYAEEKLGIKHHESSASAHA